MKKQILMLIIGILIGAIITTGVFLVLKGNAGGKNGGRMNMGEPPTIDENRKDGGYRENKTNTTTDNTNTDSSNTSET